VYDVLMNRRACPEDISRIIIYLVTKTITKVFDFFFSFFSFRYIKTKSSIHHPSTREHSFLFTRTHEHTKKRRKRKEIHQPFSRLWLVRIAAFTSLAVFRRCEISKSPPTGQLETSSKASSATVLSSSSKKLCCRIYQLSQVIYYHHSCHVNVSTKTVFIFKVTTIINFNKYETLLII